MLGYLAIALFLRHAAYIAAWGAHAAITHP